jgi:hypothetical protein
MTRTVEIDAGLLGGFAHLLLASEQAGGAEPLVHIGDGRAHDLLFLALGEDDAARMAAHTLVKPLQRRGDRIAPGRELLGIGVHVEDRLLGHARVHRGLGDSDGNRRDQPRIERHRDDVLRPEAGATPW